MPHSHVAHLVVPGRTPELRVRISLPDTGARQPQPVIVFSHGFGVHGSSMATYRPLADHWVSSGFIVVQPNHLDAEGQAEQPDLWRTRIADLRTVVDGLDDLLGGAGDLSRIAIAGHSFGATSASALAGARVIGDPGPTDRHPRVRAAVLLALTGSGGDDLSPFAATNFPFMNPDFGALTTASLVVAGDQDDSPLSVRGPDWFTDGFHLSPGATDLLVLHGGEHLLGGITADDDPHTTDPDPQRVELVQRATTAYLRSALGLDDAAWPNLVGSLESNPDGHIESNPLAA